jgi:hypothetical protein
MRQLEIYRRRISPKELASLGWRRVDNGPMRTFQHRDGWLLEHCGHPTAIYPYLLVSPAGERVLSGAFSGQPDKGHAWATIALAADWVASLTPADARYYGGMNLSALYSKGIGDLSHAVQGPANRSYPPKGASWPLNRPSCRAPITSPRPNPRPWPSGSPTPSTSTGPTPKASKTLVPLRGAGHPFAGGRPFFVESKKGK